MKIQDDFFVLFGHYFDLEAEDTYHYRQNFVPKTKEIPSFGTTRNVWEDTIESLLERKNKGERIVVPLSGGLDSRLILAGLLKFIDAKEIYTYTFGAENSLDFKIGNLVAKKLRTTHLAKPILIEDYTYESEKEWSRIVKKPTTLFYHPPLDIYTEFKNDNFWFGFMGDPLAGSHLRTDLIKNKEIIEQYFEKYSSLPLCKSQELGLQVDKILGKIESLLNSQGVLNPFEQIDFFLRQNQYIAPHVVFSDSYSLPFIETGWAQLMLTLPDTERNSEKFYREFMVNAYPEIFNIPCKNNLGYRLGSPFSVIQRVKMKLYPPSRKSMVNYVDFDYNLRNGSKFSHLIKNILLSKEVIGRFTQIDLQEIWKEFEKGNLSHSFILNIASMAIISDSHT